MCNAVVKDKSDYQQLNHTWVKKKEFIGLKKDHLFAWGMDESENWFSELEEEEEVQ